MDHNYKIIAVDFDGTLCYSNWPELGEPNTMLIDYLLQEKAAGNKLISSGLAVQERPSLTLPMVSRAGSYF